jgi:hypothetical protein
MTWVLAPLLVGGASTLVATLVRAAARAPAAGAGLNVGRPGERVLGVATPQGRTSMEPPVREADVRPA